MKCHAITRLLVGLVLTGTCAGLRAEGAAIESRYISISGDAGKSGLTVSSKQTDFTFTLGFVADDESIAGIKSATAAKDGNDGNSLKVTAGAGEALVTLKPRGTYAEIKPVKGLKGVTIVTPSRFALMPDFFAMDVVLDARRVKQDKAVGLADNFYLVPLDDGGGVVFCVWPADPGEETREASPIALTAGGEGDARRFTESRVSFPASKPVYVALLEGKDYWRCEDAASWDLSKPVKTGWKRPFDARWRASFLTGENKQVPKWGVSILSFYFPELQKGRRGWVWNDANLNGAVGWTDKYGKGVPEGAAQGLGHYAHPCWFADADTYVYPPAGAAKENIYDCAIIYPLQRSKDTPPAVLTPSDIVMQTLGVGPCEYILDKEGAVWAFHGGKKKMHFEGATCGNWDSRLAPRLAKWKKEGGKPEAKQLEEIVWLIEDMQTFIEAVNMRIHAYDDCLKAVKTFCDAAKQKGSGGAALAAALDEPIRNMQRTMSNTAGFDKGLAEWKVKLTGMMKVAADATEFKPELMQVGNVRGFAERQDVTIAGARRCVNMIKQRAGLAVNESGADSASLAAKIREECRKVLRNPHPLEHF